VAVWLALAAAAAGRGAVAETAGRWMLLRDVAAFYGCGALSEQGRQVVAGNGWSSTTFEFASRRIVFNGLTLHLNAPVTRWNSQWTIEVADAQGVVGPLWRPEGALAGRGARLVVLDPGHGGSDPGAQDGHRTDEKRLTLDVARRVRSQLRRAGVMVLLTRDRDLTLPLDERSRRANRWGADVFVSIHFNATRDRRVCGVETYVLPAAGYPSTAESRSGKPRMDTRPVAGNDHDGANTLLGYWLQRGLLSAGGTQDRGVRRARFSVLRDVACPSALVECGFISNRRECDRLLTEDYRTRLADGIARGTLTYLSRAREATFVSASNR
jgi:N-acetylmuramoyl-L-alanine amidase